jgi:hypothetical protein
VRSSLFAFGENVAPILENSGVAKLRYPMLDMAGTPRQQVQQLKDWGMAVERGERDFASAIEALRGCDRLRLYWLVEALAASQLDYRQGISRPRLQRIIADLKRGQQAILQIAMSDVWELILLRYRDLADVDLGDMIERAESVLALSHGSRPVIRDLIRAAIVRHVRRHTRRWHDEEVSVLIDVAGRVYFDRFIVRTGEPARPRHLRGAARGHERSRDVVYTTEAHQQWRRRNQALLKAPSEWERRWDGWMKGLLWMSEQMPHSKMRIAW